MKAGACCHAATVSPVKQSNMRNRNGGPHWDLAHVTGLVESMEKKLSVVGGLSSQGTGKVKTADYICSHLQELTEMARQEELALLVYLLEMAMIEAMEIAKQVRK